MTEAAQPTREPREIRYRNMWLQVLWYLLTFGAYTVYWYYVTTQEMSESLKREDEVLLWTLLFFIPPLYIYSAYKQGELYEKFSNQAVDRWLILLLWVFFPPAVWFVIQRRLNQVATRA